MQRYCGATLWKGRPKLAIEDPLATMPTQEPERSAEAVRRALPEFTKLNRYESRGVARRDRAVRELSKGRIASKESARPGLGRRRQPEAGSARESGSVVGLVPCSRRGNGAELAILSDDLFVSTWLSIGWFW